MSNLTSLNLVLVDNYIDNFGLELMLEDFDKIEEVVLEVNKNNIIRVDKYDLNEDFKEDFGNVKLNYDGESLKKENVK